MKSSILKSTAAFFAFYCILFIPFPFHICPIQQKLMNALFGHPVYSDSRRMYTLVLFLFFLSLSTAFIIQQKKIHSFIYTLSCYYLALLLMRYGLDKVFLHQFYIPEPNTLFTPLGQLEREGLYWSTMGTSPVYTFFMGLLEVIAAILLFFRKTRLFALFISLGILINIVAVNIGFDISVKLYSLFLLFLCIYLLVPYLPALYDFFTKRTATSIEEPGINRKKFAGMFLKWLAIGLILLEGLYPFIQSGNFNDSIAKRPYLHGVYEVKEDISPVRRFFIHRKGYIIFQDRKDKMQDYKMVIRDSVMVLTDYQRHTTLVPFHYNSSDSILVLHYPVNDTIFELTGKAINWRKLPALKNRIQWVGE